MSYVIRYSVAAASRFEAIAKATGLLRTGVKLNGVVSAEPGVEGWWDVSLHVHEDV